MHCMVLSAPGGSGMWTVKRSVEVLAYHLKERRVSILFLLLAESFEEKNALSILHRGNVTCKVLPSWPLPLHPDEHGHPSKGVLQSIYGSFFREYNGRLSRSAELCPSDEEVGASAGEAVCTQPPSLQTPILAQAEGTGWIPFTKWTLAIENKGWHLLAFHFSFNGETYDRLLPRHEVFTVDGPERLLSRIEHDDMSRLTQAERKPWIAELREFAALERRLSCASYDLVILGRPFADDVAVAATHCATGVYPAPRQPQGYQNVQRFLTTNPFFTLPLTDARATRDKPAVVVPSSDVAIASG